MGDGPDTGPGNGPAGEGTPAPTPGTTPPPSGGGLETFPSTGPFQVTSISPVRVGVAGGTLVRITGLALPSGARVLVGSSGAADVTTSTTTELVFRTPARVAARYDVSVFAPDGRVHVLADVLEYVADAPGGTAPPRRTRRRARRRRSRQRHPR